MTTGLISIDDLAVELGMSPRRARELRIADEWPCIEFSKKNIRFEPEQVAQIIARYRKSGKQGAPAAAGLPGQTARSRRRSA